MYFASISCVIILMTMTPSRGVRKSLDFTDLSASCYEPDPFNIDECFESCADQADFDKYWDVRVAEIDYDADLDATIFTYTVSVWEAGVCREPKFMRFPRYDSSSSSSDSDRTTDSTEAHGLDSTDGALKDDSLKSAEDTSDRSVSASHVIGDESSSDSDTYGKLVDPSGIEGVYIFFNGCCNNSLPIHFTKAITPKLKFKFLSGGWYWKTMIMPGFENHFGFMIFGDIAMSTGSYCVRTSYHCICREIAVPDLCNSKWRGYDRKWGKLESAE